ncbi:hypothetical protein J437_LFUL002358 [Ladona fulva]|uniref:Reverse transcriptase RNase H-like domain-containing protein n=1 Tax=Ladona fulva TaxID=123851 RepID=A0A8K0K361_LADFU|nr:hypothetical protein J437_LFUL002358 [Ladona fulva]
MASYYRRFIAGFAAMARLLHSLLKKGQSWSWGVQQKRAFEGLLARLSTALALQHFREGLPCEIHTDVSYDCLGDVLVQQEFTVAYISRKLSKYEVRCHSYELECITIIRALEKFHHYVHGRSFTVVTDNSALTWLQQKQSSSAKLGRWIMALQEDDLKIVH